jgi:hypothetical protein
LPPLLLLLLLHGRSDACSCCFEHARRSTADILRRLHQHEVLQEQSRHSRWQAAVRNWRTLRSQHAIHVFCQHIQTNLAEPCVRLELYARLQDGQAAASAGLVNLCQRISKLQPPFLTKEAVHAWVEDAQDWNSQWSQQLEDHLQKLQQHEEQIEQQVRTAAGCGAAAVAPAPLQFCI